MQRINKPPHPPRPKAEVLAEEAAKKAALEDIVVTPVEVSADTTNESEIDLPPDSHKKPKRKIIGGVHVSDHLVSDAEAEEKPKTEAKRNEWLETKIKQRELDQKVKQEEQYLKDEEALQKAEIYRQNDMASPLTPTLERYLSTDQTSREARARFKTLMMRAKTMFPASEDKEIKVEHLKRDATEDDRAHYQKERLTVENRARTATGRRYAEAAREHSKKNDILSRLGKTLFKTEDDIEIQRLKGEYDESRFNHLRASYDARKSKAESELEAARKQGVLTPQLEAEITAKLEKGLKADRARSDMYVSEIKESVRFEALNEKQKRVAHKLGERLSQGVEFIKDRAKEYTDKAFNVADKAAKKVLDIDLKQAREKSIENMSARTKATISFIEQRTGLKLSPMGPRLKQAIRLGTTALLVTTGAAAFGGVTAPAALATLALLTLSKGVVAGSVAAGVGYAATESYTKLRGRPEQEKAKVGFKNLQESYEDIFASRRAMTARDERLAVLESRSKDSTLEQKRAFVGGVTGLATGLTTGLSLTGVIDFTHLRDLLTHAMSGDVGHAMSNAIHSTPDAPAAVHAHTPTSEQPHTPVHSQTSPVGTRPTLQDLPPKHAPGVHIEASSIADKTERFDIPKGQGAGALFKLVQEHMKSNPDLIKSPIGQALLKMNHDPNRLAEILKFPGSPAEGIVPEHSWMEVNGHQLVFHSGNTQFTLLAEAPSTGAVEVIDNGEKIHDFFSETAHHTHHMAHAYQHAKHDAHHHAEVHTDEEDDANTETAELNRAQLGGHAVGSTETHTESSVESAAPAPAQAEIVTNSYNVRIDPNSFHVYQDPQGHYIAFGGKDPDTSMREAMKWAANNNQTILIDSPFQDPSGTTVHSIIGFVPNGSPEPSLDPNWNANHPTDTIDIPTLAKNNFSKYIS